MKKIYMQPQTDVVDVELENMIAASIDIDSEHEPIDAAGADSREFFDVMLLDD